MKAKRFEALSLEEKDFEVRSWEKIGLLGAKTRRKREACMGWGIFLLVQV
jgi:hypothetical protein